MINFLDTRIGVTLKKVKLLSVSAVWFYSMDKKTQRKILDWIRNDQLQKGLNEDNEIIGLYSIWTEKINPEKVAGTPYTLEDTGEFYKSLFIEVFNDVFEIDGEGQKSPTDNLFTLLGEGIVGLNDQSKEKLRIELTNRIIEYVYKKIL